MAVPFGVSKNRKSSVVEKTGSGGKPEGVSWRMARTMPDSSWIEPPRITLLSWYSCMPSEAGPSVMSVPLLAMIPMELSEAPGTCE